MLHVILERRRGGNFRVNGKNVLREFQDLFHARLQRRARFSRFEFKVEGLLPGRFIS
jgi:hypothetical protein